MACRDRNEAANDPEGGPGCLRARAGQGSLGTPAHWDYPGNCKVHLDRSANSEIDTRQSAARFRETRLSILDSDLFS
jgi:hypothetical protein